MGTRESVTINKFIGLVLTGNKTSYAPGELVVNQNYLYLNNGGLSERGGGAKLCDAPAASRLYGLVEYTNGVGTSWLLSVQGTKLYYESSGTWVDAGVTLTSNKVCRFEQAGFGVNRNLYGVNASTDGVIKVTTSAGVPLASKVAASPVNCTGIKLHKNRLFCIYQDTLYYTDSNSYETWNTSVNTINIAPGVDGYCQALEIWGDSLFIFKETGIYILPNAAESASNWSVLKADALSGTQSPDTVRRTKKGIYYLSSDNKVRVVSPSISFTSGEYVMGGSGSPVVSEDIQEYLDMNLDEAAKTYATAVEFKDLYILGFKNNNNSTSYNDTWFFADLSKSKQIENLPQPQPFWGMLSGFDYYHMAVSTSQDEYIFYGSGVNGETHRRFDDGTHNDSGLAIESKMQLGWFSPTGEQIYYRFNPVVVYIDTETWGVDFKMQGYKMGDFLEDDLTGQSFSLTGTVDSFVLGTGVLGTGVFGNIGVTSGKFQSFQRGNMFSIYGENLGIDEYTKIYKLIVYYTPIHTL